MEYPLNVAICEDSEQDAKNLLEFLDKSYIPVRPTVFRSGEELVAAFRLDQFDLILSDIYMEGMTGVEAVTQIRMIDAEIPVAFITTSTEFALESYRLSALKYIEKPYQLRQIEEILKLAQMQRNNIPTLLVLQNGREERIKVSQIVYLEQQVHHLRICEADGKERTIYEKLSNFLPQLLKYGFFSPHKSFALNPSFISSLDEEMKCFVMSNGKNIPIRRESMTQARQMLEDHLFKQTRERI